MSTSDQFGRKSSLLVLKQYEPFSEQIMVDGDLHDAEGFKEALDLSAMRFEFQVSNLDDEGPDNCVVRIYNLSDDTRQQLLKLNYTTIILQAGYRDGNFGVIFQGDIKQFRTGRLNATDTFIDILAADGSAAYNTGVANTTLAVGTGSQEVISAVGAAFAEHGVKMGDIQVGGIDPQRLRGKTMWGLARTFMRQFAQQQDSSWYIEDGVVRVLKSDSYIPDDPVVLTSATGLIGVPQQTQDGIQAQCLLNPKIRIGQRVKIDNTSIVQLIKGKTNAGGGSPNFQVAYNQWTGVQQLPNIARDGIYRAFSVEHNGDTRGNDWTTSLILLAVDNSTGNIEP